MRKWSTHYKGAGPAGIIVHFEGQSGNDAALCGASLSGDSDLYDKDPWPIADGYGKVNCPQCKRIVEVVRKIKGNEIEK